MKTQNPKLKLLKEATSYSIPTNLSEEKGLRRTATFAGFSANSIENLELQMKNRFSSQPYWCQEQYSNQDVRSRVVSEVIEPEISLLSSCLETESDGLLYKRVDFANQTFQKPHNSEDDKFWGDFKRGLGDKGLSTIQNEGSKIEPQKNCLEAQHDAHLFIIKSPSKTQAKRIAKFNRIRALDPLSASKVRLHKGSFFTPDAESTESQNKFEFELPSESQWVFNSSNLTKISKEVIKTRKELVLSTASSNQESWDQTTNNSSQTFENLKVSAPSISQTAAKSTPNIKRNAVSHIRAGTTIQFTPEAVMNKPQPGGVGSAKNIKNSFHCKETLTSNSSKIPLQLSSPTHVSPKVTLNKLPSFFSTPTSKYSDAMSALASDTSFLVGRLAQIQEKTPVKTGFPKRISKPIVTHHKAPSESSHLLENTGSSYMVTNLTIKTDTKDVRIEDLRVNLNSSLFTNTKNSTKNRERRQASLVNKAQLDKDSDTQL